LQLEKETQKNKNNTKQLAANLSELKNHLEVSKSQMKSKEIEISELKKKIKGIYDKNEKDREKAKLLFKRMHKKEFKTSSTSDQKALDAIM